MVYSIVFLVFLLGIFVGILIDGSIIAQYNQKGFNALSEHIDEVYEEGVYDCSDMSYDFENFFENIGIETDVIQSNTHCWLLLYVDGEEFEFETTSFRFVKQSENYDKYMFTKGWVDNGTCLNKTTKIFALR